MHYARHKLLTLAACALLGAGACKWLYQIVSVQFDAFYALRRVTVPELQTRQPAQLHTNWHHLLCRHLLIFVAEVRPGLHHPPALVERIATKVGALDRITDRVR